jgi:ribosomal protein L11 methylase PrmA
MCDQPCKLKVVTLTDAQAITASFRDPAGFLFSREGVLYRQVNPAGLADYQLLTESGLYRELSEAGLLITHHEVEPAAVGVAPQCRVLRPERLEYISYPYEWCFSQLQDAALNTLDIQLRALARGMTLKDASAYNMQFHRGNCLMIDTLSFTTYRDGEPWIAYRQFCQHFLAPLLLASYRDCRLSGLLRVHLDGIPLDLASALLPRRSWLRYGVLAHLHLHARAQRRYGDRQGAARQISISRTGLRAMLEGLRSLLAALRWQPGATEWGDYYAATNYSESAAADKQRLVSELLRQAARPGELLLDLGANTGAYSRLAAAEGYTVVAQDVDPAAVETCYRESRRHGEARLLPLLQDLTNPSPALGWSHTERQSLLQRGPAHTVMALALLHHLAIGNNVPLHRCADFFAALGNYLLIEFVPKSDSQVMRLLASREDIFPDYHEEGFEAAFESEFEVLRRTAVRDSERSLYLLRKRTAG